MTKAEIINQTLRDVGEMRARDDLPFSDELDHKETMTAVLESSLEVVGPGFDIKTCVDFGHLNFECCDTCHTFYPQHEMSSFELARGVKAWLCCAMQRVIFRRR